jgi:hypothetical protein
MLSGEGFPDPRNQCWPGGVPYVFTSGGMQLLQQPDKITILYDYDHQVRHVRLNQSHPAQVTPSWYGDSVGLYEGDTLVIDTVGIKVGPFAMVDMYGTPHSPALHVVERYRMLDYEATKEAAADTGKCGGRKTYAERGPAFSAILIELPQLRRDPLGFAPVVLRQVRLALDAAPQVLGVAIRPLRR